MVKKHTLKWKQKEAAGLRQLMEKRSVLAVADLSRFPASLFGEIRKKLAGKADVRVTKTRVALKALEESKFKGTGIEKFFQGSVALILTDLDPFELYLLLKKSKGRVSAKPGMEAKEDILVPAGDTGLPPGPDLSVLKAAGLPVQLKGASIKLGEDKIVAKQGEEITEAVANALAKLDIKPVEVGLNVTAAVDGKQLFEASVLDIDLDETVQNIMKAYGNSLNLSVTIAFPNKENISILVSKAAREAKATALEADYLCKETAPEILGKANRQAAALNSLVGPGKEGEKQGEAKEAPAEEKAGEVREEAKETPAEEKKEGPKGGASEKEAKGEKAEEKEPAEEKAQGGEKAGEEKTEKKE